MCFYHPNGGCSYAARCDFAHSPEELRPKPKPNEWPPVEKYLPCPEMDARGRCSKRRNCPYLHRALYSTTDFDQDFLPPPLDPPNIPPLMPLFVPNGGGDFATPPNFSPPFEGFAMSPNFVR
ncbi:hypothetical protein M3Y99_00868500 [Aphelenchoides fujianensis]|nr:hypothetical protein M3Y99_00868500 [Aphelenchoides fujianensis]